jgi:hypothetical protein
VTLRVPAWFLIALAAVTVAGAAAVGAWDGFILDRGPADADHTTPRQTEKEPATGVDLRATSEECEQQLSDLLRELEDLRSRIRRAEASYAEYVQTAMDVSSTYGQASVRQVERDCAFSLDIHAQHALDAFIEVGNVWNDCTVDINCNIDSIDPELRAHRRDAAAAIRQSGANRNGQ